MRSNPIPAPMGLSLAIFRRRLETGGYRDKGRASSAIERAKQFTDGERAAAHRLNAQYWSEQSKVDKLGAVAEGLVRTTSKALQAARDEHAKKRAKMQAAREKREEAAETPPSHLRVVPPPPPSEAAVELGSEPAAAPEPPRQASKLGEVTNAMAVAQSGLAAIASAMKEAGAPEAMPSLLSAAAAVAQLAHRAAELTGAQPASAQ